MLKTEHAQLQFFTCGRKVAVPSVRLANSYLCFCEKMYETEGIRFYNLVLLFDQLGYLSICYTLDQLGYLSI